jgi:hypothetical protein
LPAALVELKNRTLSEDAFHSDPRETKKTVKKQTHTLKDEQRNPVNTKQQQTEQKPSKASQEGCTLSSLLVEEETEEDSELSLAPTPLEKEHVHAVRNAFLILFYFSFSLD